jgi:SAM-dependent methyltransferase
MAAENNELIRRSNAYYHEGALDTERWAKIAEIPDYDSIIDNFDWAGVLNTHRGKERVAILDCGCGIGHFPRRLQSTITLPSGVLYDYDTVDISSYSLTEHRTSLQHPFNPRNSFNVPIEDFRPLAWIGSYEIIWCMHSLYTVPSARLPEVMAGLAQLLAPDGKCFIYLPKKQSAYMVLFDLYLEELGSGQIEPYSTAEEVLAGLSAQESGPIGSVDCSFDHWIEASEPQTLETYLNQICLQPDPLTLAEWRQNAEFARYLDEAFDSQRNAWRFRQELSLISFSSTAMHVEGI